MRPLVRAEANTRPAEAGSRPGPPVSRQVSVRPSLTSDRGAMHRWPARLVCRACLINRPAYLFGAWRTCRISAALAILARALSLLNHGDAVDVGVGIPQLQHLVFVQGAVGPPRVGVDAVVDRLVGDERVPGLATGPEPGGRVEVGPQVAAVAAEDRPPGQFGPGLLVEAAALRVGQPAAQRPPGHPERVGDPGLVDRAAVGRERGPDPADQVGGGRGGLGHQLEVGQRRRGRARSRDPSLLRGRRLGQKPGPGEPESVHGLVDRSQHAGHIVGRRLRGRRSSRGQVR